MLFFWLRDCFTVGITVKTYGALSRQKMVGGMPADMLGDPGSWNGGGRKIGRGGPKVCPKVKGVCPECARRRARKLGCMCPDLCPNLCPKVYHPVPESLEGVPESWGGVPGSWGGVPENWGGVPESWGCVPESWVCVPESWRGVPESSS